MLTSLAALAAALSLAGTASAASRGLTVDRGVVQSVTSSRIVLRELDGSTVSMGVGANTQVLVNGFPATTEDIQPGFVAAVAHRGPDPARLIRAFGRLQPVIDRGVVQSATPRALVIRTLQGMNMTFRVTARTKIRVHGLPATVAVLRVGRLVEVAHTHAGVAIRIAVRGRRVL